MFDRNQLVVKHTVKTIKWLQMSSMIFFTSIRQTTVEEIQSLAEQRNYDLTKSSFVPRCHPLAQQFSFGIVECKEVEKVINSMPTEKAPGNDKITVRVL